MTHQIVGGEAVVRRDRNADRGRHANVLAVDGEGQGEGLGNALGQRRARFHSGRRAKDHELVAAKARQKIVRSQAFLQTLRHQLHQLVAGVVTQRVVDVLEAIDIKIGGDGAIVVGRKQTALQEIVDLLDHVHAVGQSGKRIVLRFVPRLGLLLGQLFRRAAKPPQHRVRQHGGGEHAECHQRQNCDQQHLAGPLGRPIQITDRDAVIADERLGDDAVDLRCLRRQRQIGQQQRVTDVGDEGVVDIGDTEQKVGRALEQSRIDIGHDRHAGNDGRPAADRHDVPSPARDLDAGQNAIAALQFAQHVGTGFEF